MAEQAFVVNPQLTAISIGYQNPDAALIADKVMPRVPTAKAFRWTQYQMEQAYTVPDTEVGRSSEPNTLTFSGEPVDDSTKNYGLDDPVPNEEIKAWEDMPKPASGGPISPLVKSTMLLTGAVALGREIRVAAAVNNPSNYLSNNQQVLSGTSQWSDYSNSNPLSDLKYALDKPLIRPDTLTIGQDVWTVISQHPKLVQAVFGTAQSAGVIGEEALAKLLGIRQVLIGAGWVNTSRKGQDPNFVRVWGKNASLTYSSTTQAELGQPVWGWTAQWGQKVAGTIAEPKKGLDGTTIVRVGERLKEVIAAPGAGYLFRAVIA